MCSATPDTRRILQSSNAGRSMLPVTPVSLVEHMLYPLVTSREPWVLPKLEDLLSAIDVVRGNATRSVFLVADPPHLHVKLDTALCASEERTTVCERVRAAVESFVLPGVRITVTATP